MYTCLYRPDERPNGRVGSIRHVRISLDCLQYYNDMKNSINCYEGMNILIKRHSKANNFKAVLETIRVLMNIPVSNCNKTLALTGSAGGSGSGKKCSSSLLPDWLYEIFLGYGSPDACQYRFVHVWIYVVCVLVIHNDDTYFALL